LLHDENSDCSLDSNIINWEWVQQEALSERQGFNNLSCQLDNCPFNANPNQIDDNNDGQGTLCQ
jgi:hypothetical protein